MASHLLIVIIAAIALTIFAERRQIQAPLLLTAVAVAVSFIPSLPRWELEPHTILGIVVPPLLYSAALEFSFFSFVKRLGSILNLGVALVVVSTVAAGALAHWMIPALSLPVALVLGAAIAPPDAVSAVSVGRQLGLPNRLMTVLKGESLINDAAALALFGGAAVAATGGTRFIQNNALYFLYAAGVGVVIGLALGAVVHRIRRRLENPTLVTALAIIVPFASYSLAEELHASGVMAVVFAGFSLGHKATDLHFSGRMQEREVWHVVSALLEAFVFAYMGLQLRFVVDDARVAGFDLDALALAAGAVLAAVIGVRVLWVLATAVVGRVRHRVRLRKWQRLQEQHAAAAEPAEVTSRGGRRRRGLRHGWRPEDPLSWRENVVLSWTGMRGVVTIAAAAGAPLVDITGAPISERAAILPIAFAVALGTLMLQGLTLPWLIRVLRIDNADDLRYRAAQRAHASEVSRRATREAAAAFRARHVAEGDLKFAERWLELARSKAEISDDLALGADGAEEEEDMSRARSVAVLGIARAVLAARRDALIAERDAERLDDEILRELLEDIDLEQAVVARRSHHAGS